MRERGPDVPHLGDIEHNLRAVRGDGLNDPGQSAGGKSSLGEGRGLPTKLCADTIVMAGNSHQGNVAPGDTRNIYARTGPQRARTRTAAAGSAERGKRLTSEGSKIGT